MVYALQRERSSGTATSEASAHVRDYPAEENFKHVRLRQAAIMTPPTPSRCRSPHLEETESSGPLCVHHTLRDTLTVKVRQVVDQGVVLHHMSGHTISKRIKGEGWMRGIGDEKGLRKGGSEGTRARGMHNRRSGAPVRLIVDPPFP